MPIAKLLNNNYSVILIIYYYFNLCISYASLHLPHKMVTFTIEFIIRMDGCSNKSIYGHLKRNIYIYICCKIENITLVMNFLCYN